MAKIVGYELENGSVLEILPIGDEYYIKIKTNGVGCVELSNQKEVEDLIEILNKVKDELPK